MKKPRDEVLHGPGDLEDKLDRALTEGDAEDVRKFLGDAPLFTPAESFRCTCTCFHAPEQHVPTPYAFPDGTTCNTHGCDCKAVREPTAAELARMKPVTP